MVDANSLAELFSVRNAALVAALANLLLVFRVFNGAPKWFEQWISYRRAKAEEKAADWSRLRDHCNFLMAAEETCRSELNDVKGRLATLEGYMAGQGRAYQEAAGINALERLGRNDKKPGGRTDE